MSEDYDFDEDDLGEVDETEGPAEPLVTIEVIGLSLYTHHGLSTAEQQVGQRLVIDLRIEAGVCDATVTDRVEDTVDYAEVCEKVVLVLQQRPYRTLERICTAIVDRLLDDYQAESVWVKVARPDPPMALPVQEVAVEVVRDGDG